MPDTTTGGEAFRSLYLDQIKRSFRGNKAGLECYQNHGSMDLLALTAVPSPQSLKQTVNAGGTGLGWPTRATPLKRGCAVSNYRLITSQR